MWILGLKGLTDTFIVFQYLFFHRIPVFIPSFRLRPGGNYVGQYCSFLALIHTLFMFINFITECYAAHHITYDTFIFSCLSNRSRSHLYTVEVAGEGGGGDNVKRFKSLGRVPSIQTSLNSWTVNRDPRLVPQLDFFFDKNGKSTGRGLYPLVCSPFYPGL